MISETWACLRASVEGRDGRNLIVRADATGDRIALADPTGDLELLLGLLCAGLDPSRAVDRIVTHRDGVSADMMWKALDGLEALGLLVADGALWAAAAPAR